MSLDQPEAAAPADFDFIFATVLYDGEVHIDWQGVEEAARADFDGTTEKAIARLLTAARERGRIDVAMRGVE